MTTRLQEQYEKVVRAGADEGVQLQEPDAGAAAGEDRHQHGRRRGDPGQQEACDAAVSDLTAIAGQKPVVTKARKSIATFKLREGMPIGVQGHAARASGCTSSSIGWSPSRCRACATSAASRRKSFDGRGNYALGLKEQIVFPEIDYDKIDEVRGMDIIIVHDGEDATRKPKPC